MRIGLFAVGRLKAGPEKELAARYLDRFAKSGPAVGLELGKISEVAESRASNPETRKREEAALLEKALPADAVLLLLDERGKAVGSEDFAELLKHGKVRVNHRVDQDVEQVVDAGRAGGAARDLQPLAENVEAGPRMLPPTQHKTFAGKEADLL